MGDSTGGLLEQDGRMNAATIKGNARLRGTTELL
jgi:hypothetical protein